MRMQLKGKRDYRMALEILAEFWDKRSWMRDLRERDDYTPVPYLTRVFDHNLKEVAQ